MAIFLQPKNGSFPIVSTDSPIVTVVKFSQPSKAFLPIEVTELGMTIDFNSVQPENAPSAIVVSDSGRVISVSAVQPAKAFVPMVSTLLPRLTFRNSVQFWNSEHPPNPNGFPYR